MDWTKTNSDSLFRPDLKHGNAQPHLCDDLDAALPYFAVAFREAAKAETDRICKYDFPDYAVLPIVFMYRHSLEIYLKGIVKMGDRVLAVKGLGTTGLANQVNQHSLLPLVPGVEHILKSLGWLWPGVDPASDTFFRLKAVITEFDSVDPNSFAFRYSSKKNGAPPVDSSFTFNIRVFSTTLEPLLAGVDTIALNLYGEWSQSATVSE